MGRKANPFMSARVTAAVGRLKKCAVCNTFVFKPPKGETTVWCSVCCCERRVR